MRNDSSDLDVYRQIFEQEEYAPLKDLSDGGLILDCGANVGYSSAYFLSCFPHCEVIAVEPDAENFRYLQRNLAPYGPRARCIRAAVWSASLGLVMSRDRYRDGREWARQVRLADPRARSDLQGMDVPSLMALSIHQRIALLKMDIEGAEAVVFGSNATEWLELVDTIAIELHDDSGFGRGSDAFFAAIEGHAFDVSTSGELTICRRSVDWLGSTDSSGAS